ncbi:Bro-N domain-containing protein [Aureispira sp. CCB-QB1]|uniref:BRO-N domain-containing protein n=1 Tax=Aureispira sp. CCB-QB1 TaxID=1313421 RepID=UPI000ADCECAB|nr:Bro-N domain-containing protein [Aureispira sp. CCB-QB1]
MASIKIFDGNKVRSYWDEEKEEWFLSVVDVIAALTDSKNPRRYWSDLKKKLKKEGYVEVYDRIVQLKMEASDGKMRKTDAIDLQTFFRVVQSIPSPKAEPFKRWLAQLATERLQEIEDPSLAVERARALYKQKGYDDEWIEKRLKSIAIRESLTNEWKDRGVKESIEYAILTAEISKATFGLLPSEYKSLKKLDKTRENLRDHMTDLELIFTMLGEASTTEIVKRADAQGFEENKTSAQEGGKIAGEARKSLEEKTGKSIISGDNYLEQIEASKKKQKKLDFGKEESELD